MSKIEISPGWARAKLDDILMKVIGGGTPSRKVSSYYGGSIPWFTVKDLKSLRPSDAEEHISEEAVADSATNVIPANTLIVATRIAVGKAIKPSIDCAINQDLKALTLPAGIDVDFMLHWFHANERNIQKMGSGTTVLGIRLEQLRSLPINLPPADEQIRIVEKLEEVLSELDAAVVGLNSAKRKLAHYRQSLLKAAVEGALTANWRAARAGSLRSSSPRRRGSETVAAPGSKSMDSLRRENDGETETGAELLQRILTERRTRWEQKQLTKFAEQRKSPPKNWQEKYPQPTPPDVADLRQLPEGWAWANLDQLTEFVTSGSRGWAEYYAERGATFIRSQNINKDWLDLSDIAFVNPPQNSEGSRTRVQRDDLLLTITGANVGKSAHVDRDLDEAYVSQHVALIRPIDATLSAYLHLFLTCKTGGRGQLDKDAYGAGKPGLNLQQVASVVVPLPSSQELPELLNAIATALDATAAQEAATEHAINHSAAQRNNILKAAFAGQLVPQNPNDEPASALLERIRREKETMQNHRQKTRLRGEKNPPMKTAGIEKVRAWIKGRDKFTFDDLRTEVPGSYEALRESLFELLAERAPLIEQEFAPELGVLRFKRVR